LGDKHFGLNIAN